MIFINWRSTLVGMLVALFISAFFWYYVVAPAERSEGEAARKLLVSRERFRSLYDRHPDPIVTYDARGCFVRGNAAAAALAGGAGDSYVGQHYTQHLARGHTSEVDRAFARALSGFSGEFETVFVWPDGRSMDISAALCPIVIDGNVTGVHVVARDVSSIKAAESALLHSQQRLRAMFEHHPDAVATVDLRGTYVQVNAGMEALSGYRGEQLIGKNIDMLAAPEDVRYAREHLQRIAAGSALEYTSFWICADGSRREVQIKAVPIIVGGAVEGMHAFIKDITEQRRLEQRNIEQSERIRALYLVAASAGVSAEEQLLETLAFGAKSLATEHAYILRAVGESLVVQYALSEGGLKVGMQIPMHGTISRQVYGARRPLAINDASIEPWKTDLSQQYAPWGSYIGANVSIGGIAWGVLSFVGTKPRIGKFAPTDIDFVQLMGALIGSAIERDQHQRRLGELAFYDGLTGLPNRALLGEHMAQAIAGAKRRGDLLAVHFLDLDGFKDVNDRLGHAAGDELLRQVAERLKATLRGGDTVARVGGDEFIVVQPEVEDRRYAGDLAQRILAVICEPYDLPGGTSARIGTSIGISLYPADAGDVRTLLANADTALYQVKASGKNAVAFFE